MPKSAVKRNKHGFLRWDLAPKGGVACAEAGAQQSRLGVCWQALCTDGLSGHVIVRHVWSFCPDTADSPGLKTPPHLGLNGNPAGTMDSNPTSETGKLSLKRIFCHPVKDTSHCSKTEILIPSGSWAHPFTIYSCHPKKDPRKRFREDPLKIKTPPPIQGARQSSQKGFGGWVGVRRGFMKKVLGGGGTGALETQTESMGHSAPDITGGPDRRMTGQTDDQQAVDRGLESSMRMGTWVAGTAVGGPH